MALQATELEGLKMSIRQILNIENFDPLNIDVVFLENVSDKIPQEGYMDPAMAEHLATVTLRAADKCIDLLAQSTLYLSHCDSQRRSVRSKVIKVLQDQKVPATIIKEVYCDNEQYIEITNKYNIAFALNTWLENKHDALLKTHHLCKDLIRRAQGTQGASSWEPSDYEPVVETPRPTRPTQVVDEGTPPRTNGKSSWKA